MRNHTVLIVGAGVAGGRAAETLRQEGFAGRIVLAGAEPDRPYERPPLSKEFLAGVKPQNQLFLRPQDYYAEQDIELWLGVHAIALDAAARTVAFDDGRTLQYDQLLITTGAAPRRLDVPGGDLPGVLSLRTLRDAQALRERLGAGPRVAIVGGGFIGMEVAATCRAVGLAVTVIELLPTPLERAVSRQIGAILADVHRAHGVDLRTGEGVAAFRGAGRVEEVVTSSGAAVPCDVAIVGVGVVPATGWLAGSGLALDNGILVDEFCRTNLPGVFAAGDVANWLHPTLGERLRVEHFDNAQHQGVAAAHAMLDKGQPYAPVLSFWSDQYDLHLQVVGHLHGDDDVVFRGAVASDSWSAFFLRDGVLRAALTVNRYRDLAAARQLLARRVAVTPAQLADEATDLRALARQAGV